MDLLAAKQMPELAGSNLSVALRLRPAGTDRGGKTQEDSLTSAALTTAVPSGAVFICAKCLLLLRVVR